jgi:membrane-associated phospholipid phosphatase
MGLGFAICTANICQIFMKLFIGGLRPHFLVVCKPPLNPLGHGFGGKYLSPDICKTRGHALNIAMMSFPSGHSAAAFAGFGFLALWVNAKFKVCADYKSRHWQTLMLATPIVIATVLALSKVADYWHHWYDVLVGSLIGIFWAILCYRQMFLSVLDWRYDAFVSDQLCK